MMKPLSEIAQALDLPLSEAQIDGPKDQVELQWVETAKLHVDDRYQRLVSDRGRRTIRKLIAEFDFAKFGAIVVARTEDGSLTILDGQHRALAAIALNIGWVPAAITKAELQDQAKSFVAINANRTGVQAIDKYRARVTAGEPAAVELSEILAELEICTDVPAGGALRPRQTRAVNCLEKLVKAFGKGTAFTALEMLLDAQPGEANLLMNFNIEVTTRTLARVIDAKGNIDRLQQVLEETDFTSLADDASQLTKIQGGQKVKHGTDRLLAAYNKNLKGKVA
jgi:hypothetical protein